MKALLMFCLFAIFFLPGCPEKRVCTATERVESCSQGMCLARASSGTAGVPGVCIVRAEDHCEMINRCVEWRVVEEDK